jgi:hypothetical protein
MLQLPYGVIDLGTTAACEAQDLYILSEICTAQTHLDSDATIMRNILHGRHHQQALSRVYVVSYATTICNFCYNQ